MMISFACYSQVYSLTRKQTVFAYAAIGYAFDAASEIMT